MWGILGFLGFIMLLFSLIIQNSIIGSGYVLRGKRSFILDSIAIIGIILMGVATAIYG